MYHHGETIKYIIILPGNKEKGSQLTDSQSLRKNPAEATVGQTKGKHQVLTYRWKWYDSRHGFWSLTHREFHAFLIPNDVFLLFSMTNEIKIIHWNT